VIIAAVIPVSACVRLNEVQPPAGFQSQALSSNLKDQLTWNEIESSYGRIRTYQCLYEKEERAISDGEKQTIKVSFRKPFDVRLEWLNGGKVDQTAVYRQGQNDGKVLARQSGLLGVLTGTIKLDPTDKLALSDSRHPITEMGIGKIIERAQHDAADHHINMRLSGEESLDGRATYRFEFGATKSADVGGVPGSRRALIWVDRELKLPIKLELYDGSNVLLERHHFRDLRVDVNLPDKLFTL
jgi:hypothetical protein